ncbi:location of vulva defective 1-like [Branchiostoma floridae]|uniref:Location of vulva defective 1-like n=1 Tax=Branchiostoma floridae TaxID=7739 RepID=A0A9J7HJD4_BRAFL|nr:location of vulva defective 1-like [Branchiostoma floridae]
MVKPGVLWMTILVATCFQCVGSRADDDSDDEKFPLKLAHPFHTDRRKTPPSQVWTPYLQTGLNSQVSTTDRHMDQKRTERTKQPEVVHTPSTTGTVRKTARTKMSKSSTKRLPTEASISDKDITSTATLLTLTNTTDRTVFHVAIRPANAPNTLASSLPHEGALASRKGNDVTSQESKESAQGYEKDIRLETTNEVPKAEFTTVNVEVPKTQEDLDDSLSSSSLMVVTSQSSTTAAFSDKNANTRTSIMASARSRVQDTSSFDLPEDTAYASSSEPTAPLSYKLGDMSTTKPSAVFPTTEEMRMDKLSAKATGESTLYPTTIFPTTENTGAKERTPYNLHTVTPNPR